MVAGLYKMFKTETDEGRPLLESVRFLSKKIQEHNSKYNKSSNNSAFPFYEAHANGNGALPNGTGALPNGHAHSANGHVAHPNGHAHPNGYTAQPNGNGTLHYGDDTTEDGIQSSKKNGVPNGLLPVMPPRKASLTDRSPPVLPADASATLV